MAHLSSVSANTAPGGASVVIEASEPVAYVATRPDPLTVLVDLRNATVEGVTNRVAASPVGPVAAVTLEDSRDSDGTPVARVRLLLSAPTPHRVHSDRNTVRIDVAAEGDLPATVAAVVGTMPTAPVAAETAGTRLESIRATAGARGLEVTLSGNGSLVTSAMQLMRQSPPRLVLDFAGVTSAVPAVTEVAQGAVERIRVAVHSANPLVTRVVFDLSREVPYTVKPAGREFKVLFSDGPAPAAADAAASPALPPQAPGIDPPARPPDRTKADSVVGQPLVTPQGPPPGAAQAPPPTATQPPSAAAQTVSTGARQYSGNPISMDFAGADLRAVLRVFAEQSSLNLVIDPKVEGSVDVTLRDVPWDQALDMILRTNKLGYVVDGTIVRIAPLSVLADEETARRELVEKQMLAGELKVMTRALSYAQAADVEPLLKGNALSGRGTSAVDKRTNTVIMSDLPAYLARADALLTTLDQPEGQVEIEARIVSTSKTFARQLGVKWGFLGQATPELGNTTGVAFPSTVTANAGVNLADTTLPSVASLALGSVNGALNLNLALAAMESEGHIKILLTPRVVTQNNVKARVAQGQEIPYTTTTAPPTTGTGGVVIAQPIPTVQFKTAALTLEVTPRITPSDTVLLDVDVDNGSPGATQANGNVAINTQRASTRVLVKDGATTVIGGIYSSQTNHTDERTPGLGSVPLLRWLFKNQSINDTDQELLIFITPRIIRVK
jgi:type IV pilus assembly protein PilQ